MNSHSNRGWAVLISVILMMLATARQGSAQSYKLLVSFEGPIGSNGGVPMCCLIQGLDGNLYGTTYLYGPYGWGSVYKMTPAGVLTTIYGFCPQEPCVDGVEPNGSLVQTIDGDFYGTTELGGAQGYGTVFKITPSGTLTSLHSFCASCADGREPTAPLIQGIDGNFYGTAAGGGLYGGGTVFRITPAGAFTTVYSFCAQTNCTDGSEPSAALVQASEGNFYGTTTYGGAYGYGTVFRITPTGALSTLYSFCAQTNCTDGAQPASALVQAVDGSLFGTTLSGGSGQGCTPPSQCGTVFKITLAGELTTLYSFCSETNCRDGASPSQLLWSADGDFYGTTFDGGGAECGTAFEMTPKGELTPLYDFDARASCLPYGLAQSTQGVFYGTSAEGGTTTNGTAFGLTVGLGPFMETLPSGAKIGRPVDILGTDLTGATSVTFNGIPATFSVVSPSEITTTVPSAATTGPVEVVTPSGTLRSNVPFRVVP